MTDMGSAATRPDRTFSVASSGDMLFNIAKQVYYDVDKLALELQLPAIKINKFVT